MKLSNINKYLLLTELKFYWNQIIQVLVIEII